MPAALTRHLKVSFKLTLVELWVEQQPEVSPDWIAAVAGIAVVAVASRSLDGRSEAIEVAAVVATRSPDGRSEAFEVSGPTARWHY